MGDDYELSVENDTEEAVVACFRYYHSFYQRLRKTTKTEHPASGKRLKLRTSQIQNRNANHCIATVGKEDWHFSV